MPSAFSDDLRCRILKAYDRGGVSEPAVAERFGVSREYVKKIRKQQRLYGQMERVPQKRHGPVSKVTIEVQQQLQSELQAQSDLTLWELQQRLEQQRNVKMSKSHVARWLQRLGLRRKKKPSTRRNRIAKKDSGGARRGGNN